MTDDREPFREARAAGLKARHEQRLENATYTAAEVKVLTEAALRLGRKEALEEAEAAIELKRDQRSYHETVGDWSEVSHGGVLLGLKEAARIVRGLASQASPDATIGRTDPGMDSDLPQDSQADR